jgi:hypothetical protein
MSFDSITSNTDRLAKCKNFTMFNRDLAANKLPQWMFITPNMSKTFPLSQNLHPKQIPAAGDRFLTNPIII